MIPVHNLYHYELMTLKKGQYKHETLITWKNKATIKTTNYLLGFGVLHNK